MALAKGVLPDNLGRSLYGQLSRSSRTGLASVCLSLTRRSACFVLNGVKPCDVLDSLFGNMRSLGLEYIDKIGPDMGHAGHFLDVTRTI